MDREDRNYDPSLPVDTSPRAAALRKQLTQDFNDDTEMAGLSVHQRIEIERRHSTISERGDEESTAQRWDVFAKGSEVWSPYRMGDDTFSDKVMYGLVVEVRTVDGTNNMVYNVQFSEGDIEKDVPHSKLVPYNPSGFWYYQAPMARWYKAPNVQITVAFLIFVNFIVSATASQYHQRMTPARKASFDFMEYSFTIIFLVELVINMYGHWFSEFWSSGWNVFDFFIVSISILVVFGPNLPGLTVLRLFRAFRVFRLFNRIQALAQIVKATEMALPGVFGAFFMLLLVISIYAILGVEFFYALDVFDDGRDRFGNFNKAFFTLFQCMTGDSWTSISLPVMDQYGFLAQLYFQSYMLLTAFLLVNIAIAILLENMLLHEDDEEVEDANTYYADVKIRSASNLPPMDITGETDPYVEVRFVYPADIATGARPPDSVFFTTAPKNEYNPVWEESFRCLGRPERVDMILADKDFGVKGGMVRVLNWCAAAVNLMAINSVGDEIIGVQRRNYRKLFQLLEEENKDTVSQVRIEPIQYTLPIMETFARSYSDEQKPMWVYNGEDDNGRPKICTLSILCGVGRSLYTADTIQVLGQVGDLSKMVATQTNMIRAEMAALRQMVSGEPLEEKQNSPGSSNLMRPTRGASPRVQKAFQNLHPLENPTGTRVNTKPDRNTTDPRATTSRSTTNI